MILVDVNLLLYAVNSTANEHEAARRWVETTLGTGSRVGLPWPTLLGFVRIATNPRVFDPPLDVAKAWSLVEGWLEAPGVWIPQPTERHRAVLGGLLRTTRVRAGAVSDAHLAALCIEHGLTLQTTDGAFAKYPGLSWANPLVVSPA